MFLFGFVCFCFVRVEREDVDELITRAVFLFVRMLPTKYCVSNCGGEDIIVKFTTREIARFIYDAVGVVPDRSIIIAFERRITKLLPSVIVTRGTVGTTYRARLRIKVSLA